jgi:endoglucanase
MSTSTILKGINLSGFSDRDKDWYHPKPGEEFKTMMDHYRSKGMNFFRVPIWWDRLQPEPNQPFDTAVWDQVQAVVDYGLSLDCTVMINNHCMGGRKVNGDDRKLGDPQLPYGVLADFWTRVADTYKGKDKVWFDLINEPENLPPNGHITSTNALVCIYNEAISAIRTKGAMNRIVLEGNGWNNAMSFNQNPWYNLGPAHPTSGEALHAGIFDPADNWCVSCHNYPDDPHGDGGNAVDATILRTRFQNVMDWAAQTNIKVICGEWGVIADDPHGQAVTNDYLDWLESPENRDKVLAWSWWQGRRKEWGGGKYTIFSDTVPEDPRWAWLEPHLSPTPPQ